jgi:hypothetical protein
MVSNAMTRSHQDRKALRVMQDKMHTIHRQITERYADADAERLAKRLRQGTTGRSGWNPLRVLLPRRTQPARA